MESQNKCSDTTGANTRSTSGKRAKAKFTLLDLRQLTFSTEDAQQAFDVETADEQTFNIFAQSVADIENVTAWTLELRRDFVNQLWEFCLTQGFDFPLTFVEEKINEKLTNQA